MSQLDTLTFYCLLMNKTSIVMATLLFCFVGCPILLYPCSILARLWP